MSRRTSFTLGSMKVTRRNLRPLHATRWLRSPRPASAPAPLPAAPAPAALEPFVTGFATHSGAAVPPCLRDRGAKKQHLVAARWDYRGYDGSRSQAGEMLQAEPSMGSAFFCRSASEGSVDYHRGVATGPNPVTLYIRPSPNGCLGAGKRPGTGESTAVARQPG